MHIRRGLGSAHELRALINQNNSIQDTTGTLAPQAQQADVVRVDPQVAGGIEEDDERTRRARVEELRRQVRDGSYERDSMRVAERVIRDLL
jgi:anti-sigma28 factor (negative regulator of flagellin synthesis)